MKTIYQGRNKLREKRSRMIGLGLILGLFIFILIANFLFPHFFSPVTQAIGLPMLYSQNAVGNGGQSFWDILHSKMTLSLENRSLREKLALMDAIKAERDSLKQENTSIRALMGRTEAEPRRVLAQVISKPGFSPYDTLIIDAGSKDKIQTGDYVYVDQSVLIGEIASVNPYSATILLYSAPDQKNTVLIGSEALESVAYGAGGGVFVVKLPQNADVHEGDIVNFGKVPDAIFGSVTHIDVVPSDSFERIFFRSPADISEVKYVTIETNQERNATSTNHH